jgi:hypothetical protein
MANITKTKGPVMSEAVRLVLSNYDRVSTYHRRNTNAAIENFRFYFGKNPELGLGQYKIEAVQRLIKQGRALIQYNFALPLMDTLSASLMQMRFNPDFVPVNSKPSSLTKVINKAVYSDREVMNWDSAAFDLTIGGLLHEGCVKMTVSDKWHKLGNIGMEAMLPVSTFPDPCWRTPISSDCEHVWHDAWYTAEQIARIYGKKTEMVMEAARRVVRDGLVYGENGGVIPYRGDTSTTWGSLFKVVEQYDIVETEKKCLYLLTPEGQIKIPVEDMEAPAWLNANYPDWQPFDVFTEKEKERKCVLKTICPTLCPEEFLEDGPTELQLGCTPFKFWSASRLSGEPRGLLESVKDAQTYINYWSGMLINKIQTEGGGGAQYVDPSMFESYAEFERWAAHRNNPGENFKLKGGYMDKGITPARPVISSQFPQEAYKNLEFIIDKVLPHISKVTPAMSGYSENSNESGYLYRQKKAQSDLQAWTIHQSYKTFWNDWYESYLMAAGSVYANEMVERSFVADGGNERIMVNEVVETENGEYGIKNDMSKLKEIRHKVIISEKTDSPTEKAANVVLYADMIKSVAQFPQKSTSAGVLMGLLYENIDNIPEDQRNVLMNVNKLETELEIERLQTNITMQKEARIRAEQALGAAQNPAPPPPPNPADPKVIVAQAAEATGGKVSISFSAQPQPPAPPVGAGPVQSAPSVTGPESSISEIPMNNSPEQGQQPIPVQPQTGELK